MTIRRTIALLVCLTMLGIAGCDKKKDATPKAPANPAQQPGQPNPDH